MRRFKTANSRSVSTVLSENSDDRKLVTASGESLAAQMKVGFRDISIDEPLSIFYYSLNISQPYDVPTGKLNGKRQHKPIVIRKKIDSTSASLYNAFVQGKRGEGVLTLYNVVDELGNMKEFMNIYFEGLIVIGFEQLMNTTNQRTCPSPGEYEEIKFTYRRMVMR